MKDFVYCGELLNIYRNLLSETNQKYYSLYYEENLSLQEIADLGHVSKSYVGNIISKTSQKLLDYEDKLHLYEKSQKLYQVLKMQDIKQIKNIVKEVL